MENQWVKGWVKGKVVENYHWTDKLYSLKVEAQINRFIAGQFTKLGLDVKCDSDHGYNTSMRVARPYSLVNGPDEALLEFYSLSVPVGSLSEKLRQLKLGDSVWVEEKAGGFLTLSETQPGRHLWLLATGTGLGPFLSILKTKEVWQKFEKIILVHAVRYFADLSYRDLLESWRQIRGAAFTYVPFISREQHNFALTGRIPRAIADGSLVDKAGVDFNVDYSQVMLCGNPDMLRDTIGILVEQKGLKRNRRRDPGNIITENYW